MKPPLPKARVWFYQTIDCNLFPYWFGYLFPTVNSTFYCTVLFQWAWGPRELMAGAESPPATSSCGQILPPNSLFPLMWARVSLILPNLRLSSHHSWSARTSSVFRWATSFADYLVILRQMLFTGASGHGPQLLPVSQYVVGLSRIIWTHGTIPPSQHSFLRLPGQCIPVLVKCQLDHLHFVRLSEATVTCSSLPRQRRQRTKGFDIWY